MSLDHVAASILRDDLTNGTFRPGERLREIPLARRLSFSRSTVRKALQFLGEEGLVVLVPYTGWLVAKLEASDIEELVMLRSALEGLASRLAAGRAATIEGRLTAALDRCWRHDCMGMNPLVMAALNGDVDSGWRAAG